MSALARTSAPNTHNGTHNASGSGYTYAIAVSDEYVKIGTSVNPHGRIASIQTGNPHEIEVLAVVSGAILSEPDAHSAWYLDHHRGEWFHLTPYMRAWFDELQARSGANMRQPRRGPRMPKAPARGTADRDISDLLAKVWRRSERAVFPDPWCIEEWVESRIEPLCRDVRDTAKLSSRPIAAVVEALRDRLGLNPYPSTEATPTYPARLNHGGEE